MREVTQSAAGLGGHQTHEHEAGRSGHCGGVLPSTRKLAAWLMTMRSFGSFNARVATSAARSGPTFTSRARVRSIISLSRSTRFPFNRLQLVVRDADSAVQRILGETAQVFLEIYRRGVETSDDSDDEGIGSGQIEPPLIIFKNGTRLDDEEADNAMRRRELFQIRGKDGTLELLTVLRPRRRRRREGIEEMNVSVED